MEEREERASFRERLSAARQRAREASQTQDPLGVMQDWRLVAAAVEGARQRLEEEDSAECKEIYLEALQAALPLLEDPAAAAFKARHHALVKRLAPQADVLAALLTPPRLHDKLRMLGERLAERLAEEHQVQDAPEGAGEVCVWREPEQLPQPGEEVSPGALRERYSA